MVRLSVLLCSYMLKVTYSADKFLEKNRYRLSGNLLSVLKRSGNDFVNDLFSAELSEEGCLSR